MLKSCPSSVDVTDLQFKLQCRLKTFENDDISTFSNASSLLTCASRYGLLFIGTNSKHFQVIQTQKLHTYTSKDKDVTDYPRRNVDLSSSPKHLCVNCDNTIIAVVIEKDQCSVVIFYDVVSFLTQNIKVITEIRVSSTPNVYVKEINWNPSLPAVFTACKSDGTLGVYELKGDSVDFNELPAAAGATCFCWSPKGKQIAVGSRDGKITQYKPDLKAVKVINEPQLGDPHTLISLQWVSNYQFIGVYHSVQSGGSSSSVIVIDAPKTGEPSYTNYDDICYGGSSRPPQFYLILQQNWNFLMVASANSSEVGVLGNTGDFWTQWIMSDTARAELPLGPNHQETLPVGLIFDVSSTTPLPWGESSIPPCPLLCILSHQGVLCCFNVVYLKPGIPSVCTPADSVQDTSGLGSFVTKSGNKMSVTGIVQANPAQPSPAQLHFGMGNTPQNVNPTVFKNPALSVPVTVPFTTPTQSTPLISGKVTSDISSKTLFGGQATLTPIKPQQPSQSLFGGQTLITPISKGPNATSSIPTYSVNQPTNIGTEKYASLFSSLNPTLLPPANTVPVKPIVINAAATTAKPTAIVQPPENPNAKALEHTVPKGNLTKQISTPAQETQIVDPRLRAETSAMLSQMIRDEWMYLEAELKILLNQGRTIKINLGTDQEKIDMITQIELLQEFVKEAVDISVGQSSEIHCLKQNLIQSWAWFEEANSYYNSSKNEAVALLLKLQPLDSVSQKRLKDIEQLTYYIESQLQQTSKTLDEQWGNFQDYAKKTHRVQMPTMEAIFQTMVRQSAILQKQTYILKDISLRLRKKTFGVSSLILSIDKAESLAEDLKDLHLDAHDILQLQYEKIKKHTKILSNKKASMLRALLKQREVTHITAVRPQLSSWTINQSTASRMGQSLSILGAQVSPVSKSTVAKSLSFIQSTPLKSTDTFKPTQVSQGLTFSSGSSENTGYAVTANVSPAPSGFVSLAKSGPVISNSQGSAFAPIGFTPTSSVSSENQQIFPKTNFPTIPFSFSSSSHNTSKTVPSSAQVKPNFSSPTLVNTPSSSTTFTSGPTVSLSSSGNSVFKSGSTTVIPQSAQSTGVTPSFAFSFGSSTSTTKGMFEAPLSTTNNQTHANNLFFSSSPASSSISVSSSSSPAVNSCSAPIKLTNVATTASPSATVKPQPAPSNKFGSQQSSFASLNKSASVTMINTAVSTSTPKTSSGVASIFANLQSVIDKATGSNGSTTTTTETTKPTSLFGTPTGPTTTTTPSLFGSVTSSSATPIFGASTFPSSVNVFGNMSKPVETVASTSNTSNIFGSSSSTSVVTMSPFSKPQTLTPASGTPASGTPVENTIPSETTTKTFSVITSTAVIDQPSPGITSTVAMSTTASKNIESSTLPTTAQMSSSVGVFAATTTSEIPSISSSVSSSVLKPEMNIFGAATSSTTLSGTTPSIFASPKNASVSASSVFETTSQSIFGNVAPSITTLAASSTTDSNIFGTTTSNNIFASGTSVPIFGTSEGITSAAADIKTFSSTTSSASGFGTAGMDKTIFVAPTAHSVFAPTTTSTSTFIPTTTVSEFGTPVTSSSIFSSSGSVFASNAPTSTSNIFGTQATTSANIFGSPTSTSSANIFGAGAPAPTAQNIFGGTTNNAAAPFGSQGGSIFGTSKPDSVFSQQSGFGNQATTASSIFGQPATFGSTTSDFGTSTTTTSGNIFGNALSSSSEFGTGFGAAAATNTFGSQPTTQAPSTGSFGFGNLNVGVSSSSTGSIFGTSSSSSAFGATPVAAANPFGKVENKPPFGSSGSNIFGSSPSGAATGNIFASTATTASSVFGSNTGTTFGANNTGSGFGSPSTFGSSPFGQKPAFGQASTFGSNTFGTPQSGSFSGGGTSPIAQTGFGTSAAFPKPSGFGSPPVYSGSPTAAFGAAPSFGGAPAFGTVPAFGSPEKVFGASQPASSGFGAATTQQSPGFGNLASQNTIGFGSLAQQANTQTSSPFSSGNSSFSSWR